MDAILLSYAMSFVGKQYLYGGSGPLSGFDCSGLVIEILKGGGILPNKFDASAQGLFDRFTLGIYGAVVFEAQFNDLVFYGKSTKAIEHVCYVVDAHRAIGANGGTSRTLTFQSAVDSDAFVKLRSLDYRGDRVAIVRPHQPSFA